MKTRLAIPMILLLVGASATGADVPNSPDLAGDDAVAFPSLRHEHARHPTAAQPGEFEIAQYGEPEDLGAYRFGGFEAVEFNPPFDSPYTITRISFPSFTANGGPAVFPSVRLCEWDPASGLVNLNAPLFKIAPFVGSPDGINEVPINLEVTDPDKVFFWCVEFPARSATFPNDYPYLRLDARDTERGPFGTSYGVSPAGSPSVFFNSNLVVSMFCVPLAHGAIPIEAPKNLGANRINGSFEFTFEWSRSGGKADSPTASRTVRRTELLYSRNGLNWTAMAAAASGTGRICVPEDSVRSLLGPFWAVQAVDREGRRSLRSNMVWWSPFIGIEEPLEPDGRIDDATPVSPESGNGGSGFYGTIYPAGDQDFYKFTARPGDEILTLCAVIGPGTGTNDLDPVMLLYDDHGRMVASDDTSGGGVSPQIVYRVPAERGNKAYSERRFTLLISDVSGSIFSPSTAPRVHLPVSAYLCLLLVNPTASVASSTSRESNCGDAVRILGTKSAVAAGRVEFAYEIPSSPGAARAALRIYDVRGRLVRVLFDRAELAGRGSAVWDCRDEQGRQVPAGVYFAQVVSMGSHANTKFVVVR